MVQSNGKQLTPSVNFKILWHDLSSIHKLQWFLCYDVIQFLFIYSFYDPCYFCPPSFLPFLSSTSCTLFKLQLRACSHDPGTTHCPGATHWPRGRLCLGARSDDNNYSHEFFVAPGQLREARYPLYNTLWTERKSCPGARVDLRILIVNV